MSASAGVLQPLLIAIVVTAVATTLSYLLPPDHSATGVGACFCIAVYVLVLRGDTAKIRHHGLSLAGLLEPSPLTLTRIVNSTVTATGWAIIACLVLLVPFAFLYPRIWAPDRVFELANAPKLDEFLGQLLVIAIPEEMFYRGYLQTAFDDACENQENNPFRTQFQVFGTPVGVGLLLSSLVFAFGHLATRTDVERLAVFFPSLAFGWLRARTGGIGAPALFHALCNVAVSYLAACYFGH